jgi:hypothetical protein
MSQQPPFEAAVRVGKGVRPLAQHGRLRAADGLVTVFDSKGKVVASAPIGEVDAAKLSLPLHGLRLTLAGTAYNLDAAGNRWRRALLFGRGITISGTSRLTSAFVDYLDRAKRDDDNSHTDGGQEE